MSESEVIELLKTSINEQEWDNNCDVIKQRCGGYPDFWYSAVILSGVAAEIQGKW